MITREHFSNIYNEIVSALESTLNALRGMNTEGYILFLADGEYKQEYIDNGSQLNPYVIDNRMDWYMDETRVRFLPDFLALFYGFPAGQAGTDDNHQRLNMELMIYTHIWESKPFLKKLYRLAHLANGEAYSWTVNVPDNGKHNFIRNDIRATFEALGNPLAEIIHRGFLTTLRNAFAHSEYFFDVINNNRRIILCKEHKLNWEPGEISFDDWSVRFVYSSLLSYLFFHLTHQYRSRIANHFDGHVVFTIQHPNRAGEVNPANIRYDPVEDGFNFEH